jgi:hypothetical protein
MLQASLEPVGPWKQIVRSMDGAVTTAEALSIVASQSLPVTFQKNSS